MTRSRSPNLVRHVIKRDGRKRRKKSLYAQKPYVYVRIKSLYAQKPYVYVRIKLLYGQNPYVYVRKSRTTYAKVVHRTHKSLQAHKSLTRKIRTFTYALSRFTRTDVHRTHKVASSAQAVYVRNKSLTHTSRTIRTQ